MFGPGESVDTATTVQFETGTPAEGVVQELRKRAVRARITAAYALPITSRYAPYLLGYVSTYTSYLRKKPRQQGVPRAGRGRGEGEAKEEGQEGKKETGEVARLKPREATPGLGAFCARRLTEKCSKGPSPCRFIVVINTADLGIVDRLKVGADLGRTNRALAYPEHNAPKLLGYIPSYNTTFAARKKN